MKLDEVLILLGAHGRYQVGVYLAISFFDNFLSIWHMSVMAFLGFEPEHHCKVSVYCILLYIVDYCILYMPTSKGTSSHV